MGIAPVPIASSKHMHIKNLSSITAERYLITDQGSWVSNFFWHKMKNCFPHLQGRTTSHHIPHTSTPSKSETEKPMQCICPQLKKREGGGNPCISPNMNIGQPPSPQHLHQKGKTTIPKDVKRASHGKMVKNWKRDICFGAVKNFSPPLPLAPHITTHPDSSLGLSEPKEM